MDGRCLARSTWCARRLQSTGNISAFAWKFVDDWRRSKSRRWKLRDSIADGRPDEMCYSTQSISRFMVAVFPKLCQISCAPFCPPASLRLDSSIRVKNCSMFCRMRQDSASNPQWLHSIDPAAVVRIRGRDGAYLSSMP